MKDLYLNDILNLSEEQIKKSKIVLDMTANGINCIDIWDKSNPKNRDVSYTYWSNYGKNKNFKVGERCYGFVRISGNKYLLTTVGDILEVPDYATCKYRKVEKYDGLLGRLIVEIEKGNKFSRYVFCLKTFLSVAKVIEILPKEYEKIKFEGLDKIHLKYSELKLILNNEKYSDYRSALLSVKGVYCLTDTKTGKLYIGSAYGENGVAQRWNDYLNTKTGGNKALIDLYNKKGEKYFEKYFEFTLIEFFGMYYDEKIIKTREQYWKDAFVTKEKGYNRN